MPLFGLNDECRWIFCWLLLLKLTTTTTEGGEIVQLTSDELYQKLNDGEFHALVDVRTREEWELGHIEGAYFVESLALYTGSSNSSMLMTDNNNNTTLGRPADLEGCEYCDLAIYCRSGARAETAIQILQDHGFQGTLYNGLGVNDWIDAGYSLVNESSIHPPCTFSPNASDECRARFEEASASSAVNSLWVPNFSSYLVVAAISVWMGGTLLVEVL